MTEQEVKISPYRISPRGVFHMKVIRESDGAVLEEYTDDNLIVNLGRNTMAALLGGASTATIQKIAVGTNGTSPLLSDTSLTGVFSKSLNGKTYPSTGVLQCDWSIETSEANGMSIQEFGLLITGDVLFSRKTRTPIAKDNTFRLEGVWKIIF